MTEIESTQSEIMMWLSRMQDAAAACENAALYAMALSHLLRMGTADKGDEMIEITCEVFGKTYDEVVNDIYGLGATQ